MHAGNVESAPPTKSSAEPLDSVLVWLVYVPKTHMREGGAACG